MENKHNFFIWGLSGSGKDTIANHLHESYNYLKIRIADTVKRIICEKENLTFDELEIKKRNNPDLRKMHNFIGRFLDDTNGTTYRINQLIDGTALDYQFFEKEYIQNVSKVAFDCRSIEWCEQFIKAGWTGLFLTRTTQEFKDSGHFTENNIFEGTFQLMIEKYKNRSQFIVIQNHDAFNTNRKLIDLYDVQKLT